MKTNILVQYDGGGYDGCIWEWNYFYIDKQGTFHDIQSSGIGGIDNLKAGQELIENDGNGFSTRVYIYNMDNEQDIITFNKECNPVHITGVLQWFEDNPDTGVEFFAVCSECDCRITECSEIALENWHGCGGIESTADVLLCRECHAIGTCDCCDEFVGAEDLAYTGTYAVEDEYMNKAAEQMEADGYDGVCSGCLEYKADLIKTEEFEDLRWQSFCTGKPDMFSDEMRELWI